MTRGFLLFAHGARDPAWAVPFQVVADRIRSSEPGVHVELAFLEMMSPDIRQSAARLVALGCSTIDIVPLFLGAGGHVRKDLPPLVEGLRESSPAVRWRLHPPIGEVPQVIDALAQAALGLAAGSTAPGEATAG